MMSDGWIDKLEDGTLLVPMRAEGDGGVIGDGVVKIHPGSPNYNKFLAQYEAEARRRKS